MVFALDKHALFVCGRSLSVVWGEIACFCSVGNVNPESGRRSQPAVANGTFVCERRCILTDDVDKSTFIADS